MEMQINMNAGRRNDLLLVLPRSDIEQVLLHIANRADLMTNSGLTRHRAPTDQERVQNGRCKIPTDEHLRQLGLLDADSKPLRRVIAVGNRNLGNNHGFIAWQREKSPTLFHAEGDPLNYSAYSCLVADRRGTLRIQELQLPAGPMPDEIEWAVFGQWVLRSGRVVGTDEIIEQFYDIRHVFAYDVGRPEGQNIQQELYRDYPTKFREIALRLWREGVPRSRYLHNCIGLSAESAFILQREGTIEEVAFWLREAGAVSSGGSKPATCGHFKTSHSEAGDS